MGRYGRALLGFSGDYPWLSTVHGMLPCPWLDRDWHTCGQWVPAIVSVHEVAMSVLASCPGSRDGEGHGITGKGSKGINRRPKVNVHGMRSCILPVISDW